MTADWRRFSGYNPYWDSTDWAAYTGGIGHTMTLPAGVTLNATPHAHPFAGACNERVIEFDLASATHELTVVTGCNNYDGEGVTNVPPDNSKRWGLMAVFDLYLDSTKMPTTDFRVLYDGGTFGFLGELWSTTDGMVKLYNSAGALIGTSTTALTLNAWQQLELWRVLNDATGASLVPNQWVVRKIDNIASTIDETTLINVRSGDALTEAGASPQNIHQIGRAHV